VSPKSPNCVVMPPKDDDNSSTKEVVTKKQKQMLNREELDLSLIAEVFGGIIVEADINIIQPSFSGTGGSIKKKEVKTTEDPKEKLKRLLSSQRTPKGQLSLPGLGRSLRKKAELEAQADIEKDQKSGRFTGSKPGGKEGKNLLNKLVGSPPTKVRGAAADPFLQFPKKPQKQYGLPKPKPEPTPSTKALPPAKEVKGFLPPKSTKLKGGALALPVKPGALTAPKPKVDQIKVDMNVPGGRGAKMAAGFRLGKFAGRILPGAGAALYGMDAVGRAKKGDYGGAALSGLGAGLSLVPGVGLLAGLAPAGVQMATDAMGLTGDRSIKPPKPAKPFKLPGGEPGQKPKKEPQTQPQPEQDGNRKPSAPTIVQPGSKPQIQTPGQNVNVNPNVLPMPIPVSTPTKRGTDTKTPRPRGRRPFGFLGFPDQPGGVIGRRQNPQ